MFQDNEVVPPPSKNKTSSAAGGGGGGFVRNGDDADEDGQVWRNMEGKKQKGGDGNNDNDDDDEYDEEGNPKPGVIPIIPYNMDRELEEGSFDANGHYIERKDEQAFHDSWMQGITKKDMRKAKQMQDRRAARQRLFADLEKRQSTSSTALKGKRLEHSYWCGILSLIKQGESCLGALARCRQQQPKKAKKSWQKNKKDDSMATDADPKSTEKERQRRQTVEKLSDLSDKLMALGHHDVYELKYEQIVRKLRVDEVLADDWVPGDALPLVSSQDSGEEKSKQDTVWEYKWETDAEEVYGPFMWSEMNEWFNQGFFAQYKSLVVREIGLTTPLDAFKGFVAHSAFPK